MTTTPTTRRADQGVLIVRQLMDFDHDEFLASLADDVEWAVPGNWEGVSGVKDKAAIAAFLPGLQAIFPHGLRTEIVRATADADTAVVEIRCCAETVNGVDYDNRYCFALDFERDAVRPHPGVHRHPVRGSRAVQLNAARNRQLNVTRTTEGTRKQ